MDRELLQKLKSHNLVKLNQAIQTKEHFYLISEFLENGSLEDFLIVHENQQEDVIKFFAAEIIKIIEFLHSKGIIHGHLSPKKIFIGANRHLKLADFGKALIFNRSNLNSQILQKIDEIKELEKLWDGPKDNQIPYSILEYICPEYLHNYTLTTYSDLWSLGCIIYKLFVGRSPFYDQSEFKMREKILNCDYYLPQNIPTEAQSLIKSLLVVNSEQRLGAGNINELYSHPYFGIVDWSNLHLLKAPYRTKRQFNFYEGENQLIQQVIRIEPKPLVKEIKEEIIIHQEYQEKQQIILEQPVKAKPEIIEIQESQIKNEDDDIQIDEDVPPMITESFIMKEHGEQQVLKGIILKKCGWVFYQPRVVILYDSKILRYFHPIQGKLKGEIPINKNLKVEQIKKDQWQITTPQRIYYFQDYQKSIKAGEWVKKINEMINSSE